MYIYMENSSINSFFSPDVIIGGGGAAPPPSPSPSYGTAAWMYNHNQLQRYFKLS